MALTGIRFVFNSSSLSWLYLNFEVTHTSMALSLRLMLRVSFDRYRCLLEMRFVIAETIGTIKRSKSLVTKFDPQPTRIQSFGLFR